MLEMLLKILSWNLPSPEITLEDDGDIGLNWRDPKIWLLIDAAGGTNWTIAGGAFGTDIDEMRRALERMP